MRDSAVAGEGFLEVIVPGRPSYSVPITEFPFLIGRGADSGNHVQLSGRHISRSAAAIVFVDGFYVEDLGQRSGVFLNGTKIVRHALRDGDIITFGSDNHKVMFRMGASSASVENLITRIQNITRGHSSPGDLDKINLLLQATMLLQSELPLDAILATMLDHAITVTEADRSLLLEADADKCLHARLARSSSGSMIQPESFSPSQTALQMALGRHSGIVTEDIREADTTMQAAESIIAQQLRSVVVIPLYARLQQHSSEESADTPAGHLLGVLYLDSRRPAAFSRLDRQILDAIAAEAASILENAHLVERERQRRRLEQEVAIARDIQQALLPSGFRDFPHLTLTGTNWPCLGVGGDYFDVFPLRDGRTAFLIADVSGKGLGAALLTTMLQGALSGMKIGADPASVFSHINAFLCEHSDVGRYATVFFGVLDCDGSLEFINAGHPSPLLFRAGEIHEPFSDGCFPVGLIGDAQYATSSIRLQPDDVLVMFSDGVTEAQNTEEAMFGISRLREVLVGKGAFSLETLQAAILESVQAFSRGADQADDITLLLARYRSPAR